jgi:hypothetical protein
METDGINAMKNLYGVEVGGTRRLVACSNA